MRYDKHWRHKKRDLDGSRGTLSKPPLFGSNKVHATSGSDVFGDDDSVGAIIVIKYPPSTRDWNLLNLSVSVPVPVLQKMK